MICLNKYSGGGGAINMSYSDTMNAQGLIDKSCYELLSNIENDYLNECINEIKKSDRFSILGGGDRAIGLARCLHSQYNLTASNFLVNKQYNPPVGKMISIADDISIPIEEYERYVKNNNEIVVVLGIPKGIVSKNILDNNIKIIAFNFSTCIDGNYYLNPDYIQRYRTELDTVFDLLADRYSQECYVKFVEGKISGKNIEMRPAPWSDTPYLLEDLMSWNETEIFIDGGAFIGDFIDEIYQKMPFDIVKEFQVYSFEPDVDNFKIMYEKWKNNEHVITLNKGISSENGVLCFDTDLAENARHISDKGDLKIEVDSIDNVLGDKKATFIKMDIEGSELDGLKGAKNQIMKNKPRLAICLYHKQNDIFEIPLYIHELRIDYKFFVRPHSSMPTELVLYCI
jgi:FkbM family methyltransferase